jgi:hypothetical protein
MAKSRKPNVPSRKPDLDYGVLVASITDLLDHARRSSARAVNGILTAAYWEIGRRIVEFDQGGKARAEYGEALIERLAHDLGAKAGRGFSERNLRQMRAFYLGWEIRQTPSAEFVARAVTPSDAGVGPSGQGLTPISSAPAGVVSLAAAVSVSPGRRPGTSDPSRPLRPERPFLSAQAAGLGPRTPAVVSA